MNNSNNNLKKEFHIVTNMKMYFQKNIGQIIKINDEERQSQIISKSDHVLLPDLQSMIINFVDLEIDDHNDLSINQSIQTLSSTNVSNNRSSRRIQIFAFESFSLDSECEEF
ncbi:unnamed protein product [Paramecium sonneborni]|uniref:Uncharacterized protein n=1 Tax=Paramecium sonneborni TaxID=65129 RepID=A0A8S1NWG6_9CILI|nr:unnamed protein product [Paramecium sonneborni]